ncbi:MAG: DNA recombination protein RmuC [Chloroflexota bacterium]|nr:DNA recombination protein RmuC [Chloroflexota bacterium]
MDILWLLIGIVIGALVTWLFTRVRSTATRVALETQLSEAQKRADEYQRLQEETQQKLSHTFSALAAQALQSNNAAFLQLAKQAMETQVTQARGDLDMRKQAVEELVKPLREALDKIETERAGAYGGFKQMAEAMSKGQEELARETRNLSQALRAPQVRGRWGELTLRRVAELAGMVEHCDFQEQVSLIAQERQQRPDMVVSLPQGRRIAVDAKTPLDAYLQAIEADTDEARKLALQRHARQVRERVRELANKSYWAALGYTPEFVVLFLPGEPFLNAALQEEPGLLESAMQDGVVPATPSTLVALLKAVAYGWRQEQLAENARRISDLGQEIHERIVVWANHLTKLGNSLDKAVEAFNDSVGSLEHRVLPTARRFKELGVAGEKDVPEVPTVDVRARALTTPAQPEQGRTAESA